ncbi:GyrI-like domain-containing protein [Roseobacter sp. HKCCA0434]|uniref:GyrI-like domain-containing protein n=1 Tax=Roseobacter sp. HKCCA0434 TaxID=3079297 RepID=UPI0029057DB5|nr:GyrI-like domain-containing protein [Roseobacter sp. HKCCA0434]
MSGIAEVSLPAMRLAMARARIAPLAVPGTLPALFDRIYATLHDEGVEPAGLNQALYRFEDDALLTVAAVEVPEGFDGGEDVAVETVPAARTLHLRHVGPYSGLPAIFERLHGAAAARDLKPGRWGRELYQPWSPYPQRRITDVHIEIA